LTMEVYKLYNNAHYTLIDVSNDMLKIAKERFSGIPRSIPKCNSQPLTGAASRSC
jgi:ubiquinone/menaquinone biosynthesis C-methylase UbiE